MRRAITSLIAAAAVLFMGSGAVLAQDAGVEFKVIPVELFTCTYNDRKGPDDLKPVIKKWNEWADDINLDSYSAWTMVPYYFGPGENSGFDFIWMGAAKDAVSLGKAQGQWLSGGGSVQTEFDKVIKCDAHANYASVNHKATPAGATPKNSVLTFSDCNYKEGTSFEVLGDAMAAWAKHVSDQGSEAGIFHWYPVYGAGGESFDFKWIESHGNLADLGADYEQFGNGRGFEKYGELFGPLVECDSSRVYVGENHRYVQLR